MAGIFDLLDEAISDVLGVTVEQFDEVIENKCTWVQAKFIIYAVLSEREDKIERAIEVFNECSGK